MGIMIKLLIVCTLIAIIDICHAGGSYGGHSGSGGGGAIDAAVNSRHTVRVVSGGGQSAPIQPQTVVVGPNSVPINLHFQSESGNLRVTQSHRGGGGGSEYTSSVDAPFNLRHDVIRPVNQEVNEIIIPQRRITQEVRPVQETVETIIAGGGARGGGGGGFGAGNGGRGGFGFGGGFGGGFGRSNKGHYGGGSSSSYGY